MAERKNPCAFLTAARSRPCSYPTQRSALPSLPSKAGAQKEAEHRHPAPWREGTGLCAIALLPRWQRSLEHLSFSLCIHRTGASWRLNALYKARICSMLSYALSLCCGYISSGQCRALMGPFLFWVELDWSQQQQAAVFSQVPLVPVPPGFCHPWCRDTFALHASMLWSNILHHILRAAFWVQSYRRPGLFPENNTCLKP